MKFQSFKNDPKFARKHGGFLQSQSHNYLLTLFCHKTTDALVQQCYYQCIKRENSFAVYWIPFKCRENFHGFCIICIESAAIA